MQSHTLVHLPTQTTHFQPRLLIISLPVTLPNQTKPVLQGGCLPPALLHSYPDSGRSLAGAWHALLPIPRLVVRRHVTTFCRIHREYLIRFL